jgi:hypothetical protein
VFVAARGGTKWYYSVKTPHGKGPWRRDGTQDLSRQVLLFGKELTSFAPLSEVFSTAHGCGLVESKSVRLADQVGGCRMAATVTYMDLS